ncbi:hypothetical protein AGMMS49975_04050 [Clostridia bacterium]|nr:hypothetical protein AGMMS49975_04050 [Clostridia bacterium]
MQRIYDMRDKEVINIRDGCRMGFICDIEIDIDCGKIESLIIPGPAKILGLFCRENEYIVPYKCIKQIGDDLILVDVEIDKILFPC